MSMSSSLQNEATLTPGSSPCKSGDLKGGSALPPGSDGCSPVGEGPKVREAIKKERIAVSPISSGFPELAPDPEQLEFFSQISSVFL